MKCCTDSEHTTTLAIDKSPNVIRFVQTMRFSLRLCLIDTPSVLVFDAKRKMGLEPIICVSLCVTHTANVIHSKHDST